MCYKRIFYLLVLFTISNIHGQVSGEIIGSVTDQIGEPVIGVTVYIDGFELGSLTDLEGNYLIENIEPGSYNLVAQMLGYNSQTKFNILVKSKGTPTYDFVLEESAEILDEVIISSSSNFNRSRETPLSVQSFSGIEIETYPGGNNDVVQVAQTFPGVSPSVGGFRNDLIIRGGAPNETVYYLDGMEISNINHFSTQGSSGGPVGMLNVSFIDEVTLSSSAFGTKYNNPLSGVMQFEQRTGNSKEFNGNFRISASEAAITMEGPLFKGTNKKSNTTFLASVRRSYLQFLFKLIGLPFRPDYWDYQFKLKHHFNSFDQISIVGIGSVDDFSLDAPTDFDEEQQVRLDQAPFIDQNTNNIGVIWNHRFKNGSGFMETILSNHSFKNEFKRFEDSKNETGIIFSNDSNESETKLRHQMTKFIGDWKMTIGFNAQYSNYNNNTLNLIDNNIYKTDIDLFSYGFNLQLTRSFLNDDLDFSIGFRSDEDNFTSKDDLISTFSPRLSVSYEFVDDWKVNATAGRYFKIPPYTILGFRDSNDILQNKDSEYTQCDHLVLGLQHNLTSKAFVSLEAFYKKYKDFPVSVLDDVSLANKGAGFEVLGNENIKTIGNGRSYGLEFLFQQKLSNNFYGIFSYTWFKSEFTASNKNMFLPSVWDSRHLISFVGGYKLKKNWEISSRFRFAGKTPYVPTDLDATLTYYPEIVLDYSRLGEEKLDVFSQLDLRIDKKWNFKKLSLDIFIDIQNILSQTIPSQVEYGLNRDSNGEIIEPRSLIEIENESGRMIPSLGIVLDF